MLERCARAGLPALEGRHGGLQNAVDVELAVQIGRKVSLKQMALKHLEQQFLALVAREQASIGVIRPVETFKG